MSEPRTIDEAIREGVSRGLAIAANTAGKAADAEVNEHARKALLRLAGELARGVAAAIATPASEVARQSEGAVR